MRRPRLPIEVEKKYRLTDKQSEDVIAALDEAGAQCIGEDEEENIIYGGSTLSEKNAVLRLRKIRDRAILTYKKRLASNGDIKRQVEEETEVEDPAAMQKIVAELGFVPVLIYEKRRRKWSYRSVEIVIDELPFGLYMEIEGSVTSIRETELLLDLDDLESVQETYPQLTARYGKRNGEVIEARFQ